MRVCSHVFSYSTALGIQDASRNGAAAALANIHGYLPHLFHSEDAREGAMAMVERREAEFVGS